MAKIRVSQFTEGNQGNVVVVAVIERPLFHDETQFPERTMCADLPLRKRKFTFIEWMGHRWPVRKLSEHFTQDQSDGAEYEFSMPSDDLLHRYFTDGYAP